jgi:TetR/AcrR family transcriptional repressor of nem operon
MSRASDKRERLLEAGRCLIHRQGFRHTTLADIARESGVPLGNVYYYFRTKDELLEAVAHRLGDEFRERAAMMEAAHAEPRARLLALLDAVVSNRVALAEHGCPVGSLTQELNKEGCGTRDSVNHALIVRAEWVAEQFRLIGRADAQELGVALVAAVQGVILMANAMHDPQVLEQQVARIRQWVAQL